MQGVADGRHKLLELGNIKLAAVATDVLGKSGRAMLDGLVAGDHDPQALAELARGRLRAKLPELRRALEGRFSGHHALLVGRILAKLDFLEEAIAELSKEIDRLMAQTGAAEAIFAGSGGGGGTGDITAGGGGGAALADRGGASGTTRSDVPSSSSVSA